MKKTKEAGIYLLPCGRYRVRATAKCRITGKMMETQKTLDLGAMMEEAKKLRDELKSLLAHRQSDDYEVTTVASYAKLWLERKAKKLRPSTINKNMCVLSDFILPRIGHMDIARLTRRDVAEWIMWAENQSRDDGTPYAAEYVAGWWRVLRGMLRDAHAQGFLPEEVTARQEPPDTGIRNRQEKATLNLEQLNILARASRDYAPARYAEVVTISFTGIRPGEACGLHWDDVFLDERRMRIRYSVYRGILGPPKTKGWRDVPLPEIVVEALREHKEQQIQSGTYNGIVFPSIHGGYRSPTSLRKVLCLLREHVGFETRVTPQVLRRSYNTLLMTAGVDRIVLRSIMGHTSEAMTERYSGVGMDIKQGAVSRLFSIEQLGSGLGPAPTTCDLGGESTAETG